MYDLWSGSKVICRIIAQKEGEPGNEAEIYFTVSLSQGSQDVRGEEEEATS